MLGALTILLSAGVYSLAYLYFLGLRIIRRDFNDKSSAFFTALLVGSGILAATVTLEAVVLIGIERAIAGSLFYAASALGILVLALATAAVVSLPKPIAVALAQRRATIWGLSVGNTILLLVNLLSFGGIFPSVL